MSDYAKYIQEGETIDYTPSADVAAGAVVVLAGLIGIATCPIASGALGALATEGVFEFDIGAPGSTLAAGSVIYWDNASKVATTTASGNTKLGRSVADVLSAGVKIRVKINVA